MGASSLPAVPQEGNPKRSSHALLVGCTRYPELEKLDKRWRLYGPANDVVLLRELLVTRFSFRTENIVTLAEEAGAEHRPTRSHIEREFRRLTAVAKQGDEIVVFFAGHGSQQPADTTVPDNYEPDGLDEIFLPTDVRPCREGDVSVPNAITDNDLRNWLSEIRARGAKVWVIVDACHSGTMIRGADVESPRRVPPETLMPGDLIESAVRRAAEAGERNRNLASEKGWEACGTLKLSEQVSGLVAVYAAQPGELAVERPLPFGAADRKPYGLLTYTICQILSRSVSPMTYSELVQRVHCQYMQTGRSFPMPLVEGRERNREVLGMREWPRRSVILLSRGRDGSLKINAGGIQGVTSSSILSVYPPAGSKDADKLVGHVRVVKQRTLDAVVEPCRYGEFPGRSDLPIGGRCELVYVDYGLEKLRVAFDSQPSTGQSKLAPQVIHAVGRLTEQAASDDSLIHVVGDPNEADWLVRLDQENVYLVPAEGWAKSDVTEQTDERISGPGQPLFGPLPVDDDLTAQLSVRLRGIARARNLLAIANKQSERTESNLDVQLELVRFRDHTDAIGTVVTEQGRLTLCAGDIVAFRVHNRSRFALDANLLLVDNGYGIHAFYPEPDTVADNRVPPNDQRRTRRFKVRPATVGQEHVILIAIKAQGPPADFSWIAQPTIERARGNNLGTRDIITFESPLGRLFQHAIYSQGTARGLPNGELDNYVIRILSWRTSPQR